MNQKEDIRAPISVIIPVYNCEQYIEDAVQSIIAQPLKVEHIVLINDGSTDRSGKICDELTYKYSHVHVQHQVNSGVSVARNNGIEWVLNNTSSTYLMFLDADDIWFKNWLNKDIIDILKEDHDTVAFDHCNADNKVKRRGPSHHMFSGIIPGGDKAVSADHQTFAATAYKSDFLRKYRIRFHEGQTLAEDTQFQQEARSLSQTCCFVEKLIYIYRNRPGSAVKTKVPAIRLYTALFDGWLQSHAFLAQNMFIGTSSYGAITWYLNDMCIAHFRECGSRKELLGVLMKYADFLDVDTLGAEKAPEEKVEAYLSRYTRAFELRQNIVGFVFKVARGFGHFPIVSVIKDRLRYRIKMEE